MHLFMKQKFSGQKWRNKIVAVGSDEVGISTSLSPKIKVWVLIYYYRVLVSGSAEELLAVTYHM